MFKFQTTVRIAVPRTWQINLAWSLVIQANNGLLGRCWDWRLSNASIFSCSRLESGSILRSFSLPKMKQVET